MLLSGCGRDRRFWVGSSDQKPQHERNFTQDGGLRNRIDSVAVPRPQYASHAQTDPGGPVKNEPDAEKSRQKARLVDQNRQRDKPHSPKNHSSSILLVPQPEKKDGNGVALRRIER